jgi:hypothetical protein
MNSCKLLGLSAISAVILLVPSLASAQQKSLKEQLIGTWTPVSWEQDAPNGPKIQRFGAPPKGYNIFDANGRFYIMYVKSDLPKHSSNNALTPTADEAQAIVKGMIGYYGTYTLDEASKVITMRIEASSFANQLGMEQKRTITSLTPTELKYINTTVVGNAGQIYVTMKR